MSHYAPFIAAVINYLVIAFARWDLFWPRMLPDMTISQRAFGLIIGFLAYIVFLSLTALFCDLLRDPNKGEQA